MAGELFARRRVGALLQGGSLRLLSMRYLRVGEDVRREVGQLDDLGGRLERSHAAAARHAEEQR